MNTLQKLQSKLNLIKPGANVFGGGRWNPTNDLNWAFQQIRPTQKPAGDLKVMNDLAESMLSRFVPTLPAAEAGELIAEVHELTNQYGEELIDGGMDRHDAHQKSLAVVMDVIGEPTVD